MKLTSIKANMTEIEIGDKTILFSYKTPVAYHQVGVGSFKTDKKWSNTTSRHITQWGKIHGLDFPNTVSQEELDNLIK